MQYMLKTLMVLLYPTLPLPYTYIPYIYATLCLYPITYPTFTLPYVTLNLPLFMYILYIVSCVSSLSLSLSLSLF